MKHDTDMKLHIYGVSSSTKTGAGHDIRGQKSPDTMTYVHFCVKTPTIPMD